MTNNKFSVPTILLAQKAHSLAQQFAREQATPQQGKRVYLNTLAVYAVHTHLHRLNIATDLSRSDSWTPGPRALFQPADVLLPGMGKLECCPVLPGKTQMALPEIADDRLGYIAVQFSDRLDEVQLIGFVAAQNISADVVDWAIANLQPVSQLLDWLPQPEAELDQTLVNLGDWFRHHLTAGWQTLEAFLETETAPFAFDFRGSPSVPTDQADSIPETSVSACKVIDFAKLLAPPATMEQTREELTDPDADGEQAQPRLVLLITLRSTGAVVDITVRVCPMDQPIYLPANLQLVVWDQDGTLIQADTRQVNNWIELEFSGQPGERFNLKVALGEVSITEEFLI